jgi:NAD(P)-dependent dehydrogenase (short-subunit alcohol dehydrogenase family)
VSSHGKAILVTGCENPLAWYLCKKLDDLGFAVFAGFKDINNADAELIKDECSARVRVLQIDSSSDSQVNRRRRQFANKKKVYFEPTITTNEPFLCVNR